jgi:DnaJ-class molecular chaperone
MTQVTIAPQHARTCAGCLGSGRLQRDYLRQLTCHRCSGTGACAEDLAPVVVLPDQRESA